MLFSWDGISSNPVLVFYTTLNTTARRHQPSVKGKLLV